MKKAYGVKNTQKKQKQYSQKHSAQKNYSWHNAQKNYLQHNTQKSQGKAQHTDETSPISLMGLFDTEHDAKMVYVCAPYRPTSEDPEKAAEELNDNIRVTRRACSLVSLMNEMPVSSALLYPQFLNDEDPDDREKGIEFGLRLLELCEELWVVGDRVTSGMEQEITTAKTLEIPIRYMGNPDEEAVKLLQELDDFGQFLSKNADEEDSTDEEDADSSENSIDEDSDEEAADFDDSWRDHIKGVFDCLMCPCSGIDTPEEFLENFEHYFWTDFPACHADEDDLTCFEEEELDDEDEEDDSDSYDDEQDDSEEEEEDEDSDDDDLDSLLSDVIDALGDIRDFCSDIDFDCDYDEED